MKQVLQYRRSGATKVVDLPAPLTPSGGLLVHNQWSLISPGTERMLVEAAGANLLNTARQRPDLVQQVLEKARRDGIAATIEAVRDRIDVAIPLGYSCAGVALDVGPHARGTFSVGDRVACAGAGQANHAEVVAVAKNLTVKVPDGVSLDDAAFVTVGAIALQGVRIADVRLGEACVVIGLGLVGQLALQLLRAAGCRAFGIDVAGEKVELARALGVDGAWLRSDPDLVNKLREATSGRGADAILITAASSSSDPVQLAASLARDRAVVVAVGMVGMDVPRNAYYEKELQLRLSRSYGPGRYDPTYEEAGIDYPVGYVRWTEQRNMEAFLDLVAAGSVKPSQLVTHRVPIAEAERAYRIVTGEIAEPYLGILLEYPQVPAAQAPTGTRVDLPAGARANLPAGPRQAGSTVRLGVIGAGSFARSVLLPALRKLDVQLQGVATASAPSAQQTATRFGFGYAATDWHQVIDDPSIDAVLVATRHDLHATVAAAALAAGKHVFLEKPMALSSDELDELVAAERASARRVLQVGFNRRFAPTYLRLKSLFRSAGAAAGTGAAGLMGRAGLGPGGGPAADGGPVAVAGAPAQDRGPAAVGGPIAAAGDPIAERGLGSDRRPALNGDLETAIIPVPASTRGAPSAESAEHQASNPVSAAGPPRRAPLVMVYRVNAGSVAPTSWVVDPVQGGGRLVGEVCHMVDLLVDLADSPVASVYAQPLAAGSGDDVVLTLRFADGSIGTIVYASGGDRSMPKEQLEVLGGGVAAVLDDFRHLRVHAGGRQKRIGGPLATQDKGHRGELAAFLEAVRNGGPSPVDPEVAAHVTRVTFAALESARSGAPVHLA